MISGRHRRFLFFLIYLVLPAAALQAQSSSPSPARAVKSAAPDSALDPGLVTNNVYHNKTLALTCKIPAGWVLRTEELNAREEKNDEVKNVEEKKEEQKTEEEKKDTPAPAASSTGAKVLLAAFSRPPEARAEDVNASILIAAESAAAYQLTEAAQYFFPLTEVAKARGFTPDEDPYEIAIGSKKLVRGDFHKDRGTRVLHQSTLAMLSHGYAISITIIGGTDDEVEDLIDGLTFTPTAK
jgi:hypothetical protein